MIERVSSLDVDVAASDPYPDSAASGALSVGRTEPDEAVRMADVVTVHAPELPSARHLDHADRLARTHDGSWLGHTARRSIVDAEALTRKCVSGRLCTFIDTSDPEPLPPDSPLYDGPNVVLTSHIAGAMGTELTDLGDRRSESERSSPSRPVGVVRATLVAGHRGADARGEI